MKKIFTKSLCAIAALYLLPGISAPVFAQAPITTITPDAGVSAIAKDGSGNTYVIEDPGSFDSGGHPATSGEIVRYTNGSGATKVVYNGAFIANNDFANTDNYAFGIVVDASKNIYFTTSQGQSYPYGAIIKLTYNSGTDTYSDGGAPFVDFTSQNGNVGYPTGMAIDASNNLYVLLYDISATSDGFGAYTVAKFAAGSTSFTEIYKGFELKSTYNASETYSSICAITVDPSGNVYAADWYDTRLETYSGFIEKLTWNGGNSYTASTLYNTNTYCQALGCDASGNLYANIGSGSAEETTVKLVKFTGGAGSPTTIYAGLNGESDYWCFGMAVVGSDIFTSEGNQGTQSQGYYVHIVAPPSTPASGVSFSNTTGNTTTISWTNGDGAERAVFVEQGTSGSPTLTNGATYSASTSFNSGSTAGSGWYCVYNGTGSSVNVTNLSPSTSYRVMVVEYDGTSSLTSYDTGTGTNNPNNVTTGTPTIGTSGNLSALTTTTGSASSSTNITVTGSNLVANVTAAVPAGFDVSLNNSTWSGSGGSQTITPGSGSIAGQTVYVRLDAGDAVNTYSGNLVLSSTSASTVNVTIPTSTVAAPATTISSLTTGTTNTNASSVTYTATFAASITGLSASDFTVIPGGSVSGASVGTVSGSGTTWTILVNTGSGDGTVQLAMNGSGGVSPSVSNATAGSPFSGTAVTVDKTGPTATIGAPSVSFANLSASVSYTVTFNDAHLNSSSLTQANLSGHVTVTGTVTPNPNIAVTPIGGGIYTVTFSNVTGDGTLAFTVPAGQASDVAGNTSTASSLSTAFTVDNTAPSIIVVGPSQSNTNTANVSYNININDPNYNANTLSTSNVTLNKTGTANGSISFVGLATSSPTAIISGITGDGTLSISIGAGVASDKAGNLSAAVASTTAFSVDNTAPTIAIGPSSLSTTNSGPVSYTVTYTDAHFSSSTLTSGNITINRTNTANASSIVVSGSGTTRTVTLSGITGDGTLGISIAAGTATDLAGNAAPASSPSTTFAVDNTAPTVVSIAAQDPTPTNQTQLDYTITFSEPVTGVDPGDFTATTSGVSGGTISVTPLSATVYNISLSPVSGNGTLRLDLNSSGTGIADLAGNAIAGGFTGGDTYTVDQTAPTVSSITATTPSNTNPTNSTTLAYTVTFSEAVTGVNQSAFAGNNLTGTVSYSSITVTPVSSSVYTVTLNGISGDGTIRLDLNSSGTGITDLVGNAISGGFTGGDVYTIDNTPPTALSLVYKSNNTNGQLVAKVGDIITIDFTTGEAIQTPALTIAGHSVTAVNTTGNEWIGSYTMTSGDTEGRIPFNLTVTDLAGNSGNYNDIASGDDIEFDMTAPTVLISTPSVSQIATGTAGTVTYTVTYGDANFNTSALTTGGITLNTSGSANGSVAVSGSGTSYTVTISSITGIGSLSITVAGGNASDMAGNTDAGAGPSTPFMVVSSDATLASLSLSSGTLSPAFNPGVTSYTANVPYSVSNLSVSATPNDINASGLTIQVNGNQAPGLAPLNVGANTVLVTVIAQDGTTTKSYTVTVNRGMSVNANLARLALSKGVPVPGFAPSITSYTVTVASNVTSEVITPTVSDANATLTLNGSPLTSGTPATVNLAMGSNPVTIVVTAQNGSTKTYTVTINRVLSSNSYLSNLAVRDNDKVNADLVPLSPGFNYLTMAYTATVPNSQTTVTVKPASIDPAAVITVNGATVTTKTFSSPIAVNVGLNTITILVKSPDGTTTQTYTIGVTRAASPNAYLSNLVVNTAALSPAFVFNTLTYTADVPNATGSVTVKANVLQAGATFTVNGMTEQPQVASDPINLAVGGNTITVIVTAPDNTTTQTYTVTVTRDPGSSNTVYQPVGVTKPTESLAVADDGIKVHQGISPNGDGIEDFLQIDNISQYPDNKLAIMNRNGQLVYEAKGYDNSSKTFDGHSNKNGQMQLPGTYFYSLDYTVNGVAKHKTGFIVLKY